MIWMMCTGARGGMRSVVEGYQRDGFFEQHGIQLLFTHDEGSAAKRVGLAARALSVFFVSLLKGEVELAHIHMAMRGSFWRKSLFASLARLFRVPVILHLHGSEMQPFYFSQNKLGRAIIKSQLTKAATVFVLSNSWRDFVLEVAPACKVSVLPNYVALPDVVAPQGPNDQPFTFLFLGLLGKRKGIFDLLPAVRDALDKDCALRLIVGGNGDLEGAKLLATELGLNEHVEFVGWVSGEQKAELLRQADAFVLPSYNEGLPMAILEAMACGKPVISTTVGGIPELIDQGTQGLLVEPGDQVALTHALTKLASNPELACTMGQAGRKTVEGGYSESVILPKISQTYAAVGKADVTACAK